MQYGVAAPVGPVRHNIVKPGYKEIDKFSKIFIKKTFLLYSVMASKFKK